MVYPHSYRTEHSETKTTNCVYGDYYAQYDSKRIRIQPDLLKIIQFVDSNRQTFIKDLAEAVKIKSISGHLQYKDDLQSMIKFTEDWLFKLGIKYECFNIGFHELEGKRVRLPSIILASIGRDPKKKTMCVYTHLDVQNPDLNKWATDPWKLQMIERRFYGAGVASGKGVLIHWFHVIQGFQSAKVDLPVNIKFIIEAMYYHDSRGLSDFLPLRKHDFFFDIDNVIVCDSEWLGEKYPCVIYGTVGKVHYDVYIEKVEGSKTAPEDDMEKLFKEIYREEDETIVIPHFSDIVTQITPEEEKLYEAITDFNLEEARKNLPPFKHKWDKVKLLMHYWRLPAMAVGKTEKCACEPPDTKIVKRHMVVKMVPRQIIDRSKALLKNHIDNTVKKLKIENKVTCEASSYTRYWIENCSSSLYEAARRATIQVYKEDPNMVREDQEHAVLTILDRVLERSILLLPMVSRGSNPGGDNEYLSERNFYEGTKLLGAFLFQIALAK